MQKAEMAKAQAYRKKKEDAIESEMTKLADMADSATKEAGNLMRAVNVPIYTGNTSDKKGKTPKPKKKKEDTFDYAKAAAEQKQAQEEYAEARMKYIDDANKQVSEFAINSIEDSQRKEIAQIENDTLLKTKAWEYQLRQLAEVRQKSDKEYYMAQKGADEAGWAKSENGKKTTEDYIKQLLGDPELSREYYRVLNSYVEQGEQQITDVKQKYADQMIEQYGTSQDKEEKLRRDWQKRLATIPSEYVGEALEQMHEEFAKLSADKLKDSINWTTVFNDLGKLSEDALLKLKAKLEAYLATNPNLPLESIKEITTKIHEIDAAVDKERDVFGILLPSLEEYKRLKVEAADAQERLNVAISNQATAEVGRGFTQRQVGAALGNSGINVDAKTIKSSDKESLLAGVKGAKELKTLNKLFAELTKQEKRVAKTTQVTSKVRSEAQEAEDKAKLTIRDKAAIVAEAFGNLGDKLESLNGIISELGLGDTGIGKAIGKITEGVNNVEGAADDFSKGNYLGAALKGIKAIKSFGSALGIGEGNAAETMKHIQELTTVNEALKVAIEGLTEKMNNARGAESIEYYQRLHKAQERYNENERKKLNDIVHYTAAHHSDAHYFNLKQSSVDEINKTLGINLHGSGSDILKQLLQLTPEQMNDIRSMLPDIWGEILSQGKYGKRGFHKEYWENFADLAGKLKEQTDQINEILMGISFDGLRDDFVSKLADMKSDAASFTKDISKTFNDGLIKSLFSNRGFEKRLKDWYERVGKAMQEAGGTLSEAQINALKEEYDQIVKDSMSLRDEASKITGYKGDNDGSRQTGQAGGFAAMSQDQGTKLEGMFVAGLQHWSSMDAQMEDVASKMSTAEGHLAKIEEHTGETVQQLAEIKDDIKRIVRDGVKTI